MGAPAEDVGKATARLRLDGRFLEVELAIDSELKVVLHLRSADHIAIETVYIDTRTCAGTEMPAFTFELRRDGAR